MAPAVTRHAPSSPRKAALRRLGLVLALSATPLLSAEPAGADVQIRPIRFAAGTSGIEIKGAVVRGEQAYYAVEARQGQQLALRITAEENNAAFQVYLPNARLDPRDPDGQVVGETLAGASDGDDATRWSGKLPQSGRYLLVVGATRGNATYRLTVEIH